MSSVRDGFPSALPGHVASVHFGVQRTGRRKSREKKKQEGMTQRERGARKLRS